MLTKLTHISVYVTDQDEALAFYTKKLGFIVHTDAMFGPDLRWLTIALPEQKDVEISLILAENPEEQALVGKQAGTKPLFAFACTDCHKTHDELKKHGVKIISEPTTEPWGTAMACQDPYGNVIYIVS